MARDEVLQSISDTVARIIRISTSRSAFAEQAGIAGVTLSQPAYALLRVLIDTGPVSMGSLAKATHMDVGMATRQVTALVEAGLIERRDHPEDRRVSLVAASSSGAKAAGRLQGLRRRHLQVALADWSDSDIEAFHDLLTRFVADTTGRSFDEV